MQYTPSDCFDTFPFPTDTNTLNDIGERYYTHRQSIMLRRQEGLTKTYNRFHDPAESAPDIVALRELHRELDEAVACAYGWQDLSLQHGFHQTKQGTRYTISEEARREVLDRLLLLNHERHEQELQAGLFEKGTKGKAAKGGKTRKASTKGKSDRTNGERISGFNLSGQNERVEPVARDVQQGTLF